MFLLQPIMIATYLVLIGLYLFNHFLKKDNPKLLLVIAGLVVLSILIVIIFYTDTLIESIILVGLFILVGILLYIPCKLVKNHHSNTTIISVITHFTAISILGGMRIFLLIGSPFYYFYPLLGFSTLYVFRHTVNKLKGFAVIAILLLSRVILPLDYEFPGTINHIPHMNSIGNSVAEIRLKESKPIIKALETYSGSIRQLRCIYKEDKKAVILITDSNNEKHRVIYHNNEVYVE